MSPERTARGAALPFLCMALPREISDDLFILCDALIEGGEEGVASMKDLQVGTDSRRSRVPDASLAA